MEDRKPDPRCDERRRERSPDGPHRHDRQEECLDRPRDPLPTRVQGLPSPPTGYVHALDEGLKQLDLSLTSDARRVVDDHIRLLLVWNASINLTAVRDPAEIATRHVVDSLTAVDVLRELGVEAIVDLGSGGGFPGLPLAAVVPLGRVLLVDSVGKKAAFLQAVVDATGVGDRISVAAARAETLARQGEHRERWPAVTARAVGSVAELVELAFPLLKLGGSLIAWKRGDLDAELEAGRRAVAGLGGGSVHVSPVIVPGLDDHRLVVVTKRGRTADAYPRDPATRRRRPW